MRTLFFSGLVIGGLALVACEDDGTREPDKVVGIELKCDFLLYTGTPREVKISTYTGWDVCSTWDQIGLLASVVPEGFANLRKELTIRAASGEIYKVAYGAEHQVRLGEEWPPR